MNNYKIGCFLLIFLCFSFYISNAQQNEPDFKKIHIEVDREEVLSVYNIIQDHQGYIWMATNLGLIRYNGLEGKQYDVEKSNSSSDGIRALYVDHLGDIWIGAKSGLSKYNPDCDCIYEYPSVINDIGLSMVNTITEDKNKNIWIGTSNNGLIQYDRENNRFTRFLYESSDAAALANVFIGELMVDRNNNLWIGTNSGLLRFNINTEKTKQFIHDPLDPNSLVDNRISALYEDQEGKILIGAFKSSFHIYNPENQLLKRISFDANNPNQKHAPYSEDKIFLKEPFVQIIHQDQNGGYWIGTTGKGINYFNESTKTFKNYNFNLINPKILNSFLEDRQGNIWIGGIMGSGLFRMDLFAQKYHLNTNFYYATRTHESSINPGVLWVGSHKTGLSKLNLKTNKIINYQHNDDNSRSIGHNWVRSIYQESNRALWLGLGNGWAYGGMDGNGGVDRLDIETGLFTHFKLTRNDDGQDDFSYTPHSICEDNKGYLWLGAGPGGIFRSDKDKKEFKHFKILKNDTLSEDVFFNIIRIDSNGDLWASDFAGEGTLYLYDRQENKFSPYLKGFKMYNILIDDKGWLLISTWEKGLVHLNPIGKSIIQYTKKEGLPSNEGIDIVKGENGMYWVNTRVGPAKFDAKTGEISPISLLKGRYNTRISKASDGQIYLAASNGLVSFYPNQVIGNPFPPQIDISELLISNNNYLTGKNKNNELVLSHEQNDISFKYNALHFSNSEKNLFQYRLKPINDQWINAEFDRTARYFNLPPDSYTFEVMASNSDGVWSKIPETVSFIIKPAWWTTWWAYCVYIVVLAFLTERLYRFQLSKKLADSESKRLKEVDQLKNTLFTNITHEFRTPLTVIKGMTGAIKSNLENNQHKELENSLEIIDRNSDGLLHLINEMLDLAKIESGNMELNLVQVDSIPYLKYLTQSFHSLAEEKEINFSVSSEIEHLKMDIDVAKFTAIITNLISNAIKFTSKHGNVDIHIDKIQENKTNLFLLKVRDSGLGISKEEQLHIFDKFYQVDSSLSKLNKGTGIGLALVKDFVELMNGTIEVESTHGVGTIFSIKLPITNIAVPSDGSELASISSSFKANVRDIVSITDQSIDAVDKDLPLVLIVEDNTDVAHYIKTCLTGKYYVLHAYNGAIGIEMALEKIPDVIISDVMMPEKDGFEVCEHLKKHELTDHIPIIMLTAKATFEDRLTGLSHGADAYLTKPFEKVELLTRIEQLILLRKKMLSKFEKTGIESLLEKNVKNSETKFLHKIITVIHDNITQADFGPVQLATKLLLSESQLYRKLKATSGKSTAVFIRTIRLQKGKELIQTTGKTISEVAYDVGFNDPSYFSRAFKEQYGHPPSDISK